MNCPNCSAVVPDDASLFCHRCGRPLDREAAGQPEIEQGSPRGDPPSDAAVEHGHNAPQDKLKAAGGSILGKDNDELVEVDLWEGRYSPKAMISVWIGAGLLTLVAFIGAIALGPFGIAGWLILLLAVVAVWVLLLIRLVYLRLNVSYRLTSQRFFHEKGILRRVTDRLEVIDIDDVSFEQGLVDRFVDVGTIRISSSDRSHPDLILKGIEQVDFVADKIDTARRKERMRRGLHIEAI